MTIAPPTILSSRVFPGMGNSSVQGNLSWNDDGQAAFFTSRAVFILTPSLISSLPPPPAYLDPTLNIEHPSRKISEFRRGESSAVKAEVKQDMDVDEDGEPDGAGDAGPSNPPAAGYRKVRRPKNGEIAMYVNGVDPREIDRSQVYEWTEVGDEFSATLAEEEITPKAIAWSPSGLSDLGSCLLAVMTSQGQVSVYAPFSDPYTKRWEEIADLTILSRAALPKQASKSLSIPYMLQMRATCIKWSDPVPIDELLRFDLSFFAIANRAGKVTFWSYGPLRRFEKVLTAEVTTSWVIHMAWTPWRRVDGATCTARLALACGDGTVAVLDVQQTVRLEVDGRLRRKVDIIRDERVPDSDKRALTALMWFDNILVFSRAGSATFWSPARTETVVWSGCKRVVLPQVGNWAGANPYTASLGFERLGQDALMVATCTQSCYIINNIFTSPSIAESVTNLSLSLGARQISLDHVQANVFEMRDSMKQDAFVRNLTTQTLGWSGVGDSGILSWAGEAINLHNMEYNPEGQRRVNFIIADMGGLVPGRRAVMEDLESLLEDPPVAAHKSPLKVLIPHLLRLTAAPDQVGTKTELLDLLSVDSPQDQISRSPNAKASDPARATGVLRRGLWADKELGSLRLRYVLARWCSTTYPTAAQQFSSIAFSALKAIQSTVTSLLSTWASALPDAVKKDARDALCLRLFHDSKLGASAVGAVGSTGGGAKSDTDACPACGEEVSQGDAAGTSRCTKGHEWSRCSVTRLLITNPDYRVCSCCPAVSLMPPSCTSPPIPVNETGQDLDYTRSASRLVDPAVPANGDSPRLGLVNMLLEEAVVCLHCGGRWVRVF